MKRIWNLSALHFSNPNSNNYSAYKLIKREANFFALLTFEKYAVVSQSNPKNKEQTPTPLTENVYSHVYSITYWTNTFDLMTDHIWALVSLWSALSEYHIRFYVRLSESTLMNLIWKLFVFGFEFLLWLYYVCAII